MTFNKKLLAASVGTALTLGFGVPSAQAHSLLFPYVTKDTNRTTVVTVINRSGITAGLALHLQYWSKSTTDANTAACQPNSSEIASTPNDILSFDTAAIIGAGALFGDTTNAAPNGTSISYASPRHGYLVVNWSATAGDINYMTAGYWVELDLANGGAHGDSAIGGSGNVGSGNGFFITPADNTNVEDNVALYPTNTGSNTGNARAVTFWPASIVSTAFTVTPLGAAMETSDNNTVVMQVKNASGVQGAYDRNENGIDGTVPQTVRCVGRLTAAQLMPGVVANAAWAATGGWGFMVNLGNGDATLDTTGTTDLGAAVYQVDTSNAAGTGKFMDNANRIVTDND